MKKILVMLIVMMVALVSAFATDLSFLEDFQVKEGDIICTVMIIDDSTEEVSFRMYLNEDKSSSDNFCNRVYRVEADSIFKDAELEIESVSFGGMDYTPVMKGYEFTGEELIESIRIDLKVFEGLNPEVKIDDSGSYYYGYDVNMDEVYNFVDEVVDYVNQSL